MVALGDHREQVGPQSFQVNQLTTDLQLALHQTIVAVKIYDELPVCAAGHGKDIRHPRIHRVPRFHHAWIVQIVP